MSAPAPAPPRPSLWTENGWPPCWSSDSWQTTLYVRWDWLFFPSTPWSKPCEKIRSHFYLLSCPGGSHRGRTHLGNRFFFLMALRRFLARRGQVKEIRSDNGTNFTRGERKLRESINAWNHNEICQAWLQKNIKWIFNPHMSHYPQDSFKWFTRPGAFDT